MANTNSNTRATTKPKQTSKPKTKQEPKADIEQVVVPAQEIHKPAEDVEPEKAKIVPKQIDPNQFVIVRNGFNGRLVYVSPRTGERFVWNKLGDEQEMELRELRNAKNSKKGFFTNNWFMFDEDWIVDYLGVRMLYKGYVKIGDLDKIFNETPEKMKEIISGLSKGQKRSIAYRANEMIASGELDSLKKISVIEEALGIELIEK